MIRDTIVDIQLYFSPSIGWEGGPKGWRLYLVYLFYLYKTMGHTDRKIQFKPKFWVLAELPRYFQINFKGKLLEGVLLTLKIPETSADFFLTVYTPHTILFCFISCTVLYTPCGYMPCCSTFGIYEQNCVFLA